MIVLSRQIFEQQIETLDEFFQETQLDNHLILEVCEANSSLRKSDEMNQNLFHISTKWKVCIDYHKKKAPKWCFFLCVIEYILVFVVIFRNIFITSQRFLIDDFTYISIQWMWIVSRFSDCWNRTDSHCCLNWNCFFQLSINIEFHLTICWWIRSNEMMSLSAWNFIQTCFLWSPWTSFWNDHCTIFVSSVVASSDYLSSSISRSILSNNENICFSSRRRDISCEQWNRDIVCRSSSVWESVVEFCISRTESCIFWTWVCDSSSRLYCISIVSRRIIQISIQFVVCNCDWRRLSFEKVSRDWISLHNNYCWTLWNAVYWFRLVEKIQIFCFCSCFCFFNTTSNISIKFVSIIIQSTSDSCLCVL